MACFSGPEILNDGLVFCYDQGNTDKSWRGAPAVNLAASNFFDGNENFTVDENVSHVMPDGSTGIARLLNAQFVSNLNRTVSIGSYALTAGQTYTLSFYVMNIDCTGFSGNLYSPTLLRVIGNITYPTVSTSSWTRVTTTFTVPNEGPNPVTLAPQAFRDGGNGRFKLCWLQLEQNTFATSYVNGTRSNTQAVLDLTGRNTITANSLTYASNNTFSFNGSSNQLTMSTFDTAALSAEQITLEAWVRHTNLTGSQAYINNWFNFTGADQRGVILRTFNSQAFPSFWWCWGADYNAVYADSFTMSPGTWYHVVGTYTKNVAARIYVNGVLYNSTTNTTVNNNIVYDTTNRFNIGQSNINGSWMNGQIDQAKVYNRALTTIEVKQNFEATRGRYGI